MGEARRLPPPFVPRDFWLPGMSERLDDRKVRGSKSDCGGWRDLLPFYHSTIPPTPPVGDPLARWLLKRLFQKCLDARDGSEAGEPVRIVEATASSHAEIISVFPT